jgi:GTP-binding protein
MMKVNAELSLFDSALAKKPQVIAVNKIDLPEVRARLDGLEKEFRNTGVEACFISAATGEGVPGLIGKVAEMLQSVAAPAALRMEVPKKVFRPQPRDTGPSVRKEGDTFVVEAPELERLMTKSDTSSFQVRGQLMKRLSRRGITRALEKAGIKPGDKVRCGSLEWEW